jgi:hypothetical protein
MAFLIVTAVKTSNLSYTSILKMQETYYSECYDFLQGYTLSQSEDKNNTVMKIIKLTAMVMKSFSWDIMQCQPLKINQHFRVTCHYNLLDQRICQARNHGEEDIQRCSARESKMC